MVRCRVFSPVTNVLIGQKRLINALNVNVTVRNILIINHLCDVQNVSNCTKLEFPLKDRFSNVC